MRIWKAKPLDEVTKAVSGTIVKSDKKGIDVATGNGILRLLELQLPGGKVLTVSEILNSKKNMFMPGKCFNA